MVDYDNCLNYLNPKTTNKTFLNDKTSSVIHSQVKNRNKTVKRNERVTSNYKQTSLNYTIFFFVK
jgi:hypothetical protein